MKPLNAKDFADRVLHQQLLQLHSMPSSVAQTPLVKGTRRAISRNGSAQSSGDRSGSGTGNRVARRLPRINVGEEAFLFQCRVLELPEPQRNWKFHPTRRWEVDFAWPELRIGVEIQGGVWSGGKHGRGAGIVKDMEKHNALLDLNWRVWLYTPGEVMRGQALQHLAPRVRSASSRLLAQE